MYSVFKKILFSLDPEVAHYTALQSLSMAHQLGISRLQTKTLSQPTTLMGLTFPNPVGLAAGLDKNGDYIDALAALGFGFIEIGTVTPKPQAGNPKPRLFRLTEQEAIINRMGFNNKGIEYVMRRLEKTRYRGILGINIGKNKDTSNENAIDDYLQGYRAFWKFASYITINISSPNTPGLRDLQQSDVLSVLLRALKQEQQFTFSNHKKYIPLVVKISPDLSMQELLSVTTVLLQEKIDGVIATNTTVHRDDVAHSSYAKEIGGLSGKPLQARSTQIITQLHSILQNKIPIIASGGIMDEKSAQEKIQAGAELLQIYSGFIYSGPQLINRILSAI
ncbi:MAG: quinone-dependent dihydroorotate dehydrogenase [Gammaproteobacteria bacterium]|nr:quinone-dependent dihydroorotate dehydrogenase [Gammaproteobacteria bacterium]MCW5582728.1 quinone-dependent dihydroorotate dehydrogenase [Gammaproteobacteria bacterium]